MEKTILTNMCLVFDGDRVVVQDRVGDNWTGIAFPGGHVEEGESFTDAVIREIYEETGLTIKHPKLCGIKNWFCDDGARYIVFLYKTDEFSGELKDSCEGRVFWTEMSKLPEMNLASGMPELIDIYTDENISELLYVRDGDGHRVIIK
ncbi:MAG: 8-oxo-dGTP diphosphatase [Clostridia bacterium]|nr:8-oxo-dGTP diphosphatase [Clostridia bacterium]